MRHTEIRRRLLGLLSPLALLIGVAATCGGAQRPATYGEESANDAMLDYEREEDMRQSDL